MNSCVNSASQETNTTTHKKQLLEAPIVFLVLVASLKRHPSWFLMLLNELFDDRLYHIHDKKLLEQGKCGLDFIHKLIVEHLTQIWPGPTVQAVQCW